MGYILRVKTGSPGYQIERSTGEPIDEANRFLTSLWARALSPHTVRTYGYGIVILYRWMEETNRNLASLTGSDLMEWMIIQRNHGVNAHTINHRLLTCRLLYSQAMECELPIAAKPGEGFMRGFFHTSPELGTIRFQRSRGVRTLRVKTAHLLIDPLTVAQVNEFLALMTRYRDLALVLFMLLGGLRSQEVLLLRLSDVDFRERRVRVHGKGNRERVLPMPDPVIAALKKYLHLERPPESPSDRIFVVLQGEKRGEPMTAAGLGSLFRARRRVDEDLHTANPHRFRHTFGADMARSGMRLPVLQRLMGHASGLTTLRYIQLSITDIADEYGRAMERIAKRYETEVTP